MCGGSLTPPIYKLCPGLQTNDHLLTLPPPSEALCVFICRLLLLDISWNETDANTRGVSVCLHLTSFSWTHLLLNRRTRGMERVHVHLSLWIFSMSCRQSQSHCYRTLKPCRSPSLTCTNQTRTCLTYCMNVISTCSR